MKLVLQLVKPVAILGAIMLVMPMAAVADKPDPGTKGGKPNANSTANTAACLIDESTARVCSCKGISNVVLWCGETWVKHEEFGSDADSEEVYDTTVACVDRNGETIEGSISMISIKSGSQKNSKHHPEGYETVQGAPSGSGLFLTPEQCPMSFECAAELDCSGNDEPPGDEPPDDDEPPVVG